MPATNPAPGTVASANTGSFGTDSDDSSFSGSTSENPGIENTGADKKGFRVTAVVVTFNPDLAVLKRLLQTLKQQLDSIVIVDNASAQQADIASLCAGVKCYLFATNLGLGKAHNLGIEFARSQASTHVLLLDQDSLPDRHMLAEMSKSVQQLEDHNIKYSGLGCRYRLLADSSRASNFVRISWFKFSRIHCEAQPYVRADFLISSGTVIPLATIEQVGLMDESLFIDHIDTEWFMRARSLGFDAYGCCHAYMEHALGEKATRIWFLRSRLVPYHRPFRYYYIFRNSLLLYKRRYMPKKWMLADWVRLLQNFIFFGLFSSRRKVNLKMMFKGCVDGVKGVSGYRDGLMTRE